MGTGRVNLKWWLALFIKACARAPVSRAHISPATLGNMIFSERGGGTWAVEVPCNQVRNCITRSFHAAAAATCMAERAQIEIMITSGRERAESV